MHELQSLKQRIEKLENLFKVKKSIDLDQIKKIKEKTTITRQQIANKLLKLKEVRNFVNNNKRNLTKEQWQNLQTIVLPDILVFASDPESLIVQPPDSVIELGYNTSTGDETGVGQVPVLQYLNYEFYEITYYLNLISNYLVVLGTMASQDADDVDITGGTIGGRTVADIATFTAVATCRVLADAGSTTIYSSYNIDSVTQDGTGIYNVVFSTALDSSQLPYSVEFTTNTDAGTSTPPNAITGYPDPASITTNGFTFVLCKAVGTSTSTGNEFVDGADVFFKVTSIVPPP